MAILWCWEVGVWEDAKIFFFGSRVSGHCVLEFSTEALSIESKFSQTRPTQILLVKGSEGAGSNRKPLCLLWVIPN